MKTRSIRPAPAAFNFGFLFLLAHGVPAKAADGDAGKPGEVHAIMSAGIRVAMEAVRAQAEQAIGHPLKIDYGASLALKPRIAGGASCDVAIITPESLEDLIKLGKVVPGSRVDVTRVPAAVGQTGDAPKRDISTMAAFKETLLKAKSIRYTANGATLPSIQKAFETLGIADEMKAKTLADERAPLNLAKGEYDLYLHLTSEVLPVKTMTYLGVFPAEVQLPAVMSAGVCTSASDQNAAKALIQFLQGPAIEPFLQANGMLR